MQKSISTLSFILISVWLFGQNENPYSQFGYEALIMPERSKSITERVDRIFIINADTSSVIGMVALDAINRKATTYNRNGLIIKVDSLDAETKARWISPDPYGQFSSPYLAIGNNPVSGIDPDGGWSSRDAFLIGFGVGAASTAIIAKGNGASDMEAFGLAILGGAAVGYSAFRLNNIGKLPSFTMDATKIKNIAFGASSSMISVLIDNVNGRQNILKNDGGRLGGHVSLVFDDQVISFTSGEAIPSFINSDPNGDGYNRLSIKPQTWHSKGLINYYDVRNYPTNQASARFDFPLTDEQVKLIKDEISNIELNPPNYGVLNMRCTSFAARILRAGKVIGNGSKQFQESPFQFRRYMNRKYGDKQPKE